MIVISDAVPKSGSSLFFEYTRDLVYAAFPENGNQELMRRCEIGELEGGGGFIVHFGDETLDALRDICEHFGPVVVKAHYDLNESIRRAVEEGIAKVTFIHRDPRDLVLSTIDEPEDWAPNSLDEACDKVKWWVKQGCYWLEYEKCFDVRYFDLVTKPLETMEAVVEFLGLELPRNTLSSMVLEEERYRNHRYNTGKALRFPDELTEDKKRMLTQELHDEILALGYEL